MQEVEVLNRHPILKKAIDASYFFILNIGVCISIPALFGKNAFQFVNL